MNRDALLQALAQKPDVTVLIVGGGINGLGVLRELALQGVDALLIDKGDFCSGASAAPSRMIHGGLRYLENGEFRLVRESLRERNLLLQNAPHYVHPLPTTVPIYNWFSGLLPAALRFLGLEQPPVNRGALLVKIGLTLYDLFAGSQRILPRHRFRSRAESLQAHPNLNGDIVCTATYYDAWIAYPERLGLELALDAAAIHPQAHALNYVSLIDGSGEYVTLRDELSGQTVQVRPQMVVNAGGAWIDSVNQALNQPTSFIGGTKGSHLIINHPDLLAALGDEMLFYENADGRICIMFPLLGKVLAGSTDIRIDDPEAAICEADEIAYILESIRQVLPAIDVQPADVVYHFCGVRPLPRMQTATTGQISRDHHCDVIEPTGERTFPVYNLIGGKWTTFRAFAEQVTDTLLQRLGRTRNQTTDSLPIGGGKGYPNNNTARQDWLNRRHAQTGLPTDRLETLLQRYGARAEAVAAFLTAAPDEPLVEHPGYSRREIAFLVTHEQVHHLDDLVLRRTTLALQGELTAALLLELGQITAAALGWSDDQTQSDIERTSQILAKRHGVHLPHTERVP
ncbi:MAG: glycerol-3-phosphate dehydrogenase [Anaerolineaceae bacterium]|nr:glycerol-3-phosphate dehydrogenase [Anaerolineaceae bacterium]